MLLNAFLKNIYLGFREHTKMCCFHQKCFHLVTPEGGGGGRGRGQEKGQGQGQGRRRGLKVFVYRIYDENKLL